MIDPPAGGKVTPEGAAISRSCAPGKPFVAEPAQGWM
jgi:hypothetical protein